MKVYAKEIELGLKDNILSNRVVKAYCPVRPLKNPKRIAAIQKEHARYTQTEAGKVFASYADLYYVDTILVSSSMNKNDDYFESKEIWRARSTPVHKPTNIAHIPDLVCGVMYQTWVLTPGKRRVISDNTAETDLPDLIHLACSAVIWRELGSMYQGAITDLIVKIEADEMAVSMEAHFDDFDFALYNEETGSIKIVQRNEETAWMTGLLRWFGGSGIYTEEKNGIKEYYRIGRSLKDITFTGKGFVTNPANVDSIILDKSFEKSKSAAKSIEAAGNNRSANNTVGINTNAKENKKMTLEIDPKTHAETLAKAMNADKLERENERLLAKIEKLNEEMAKANKSISEYEFGKKDYETLLEAAKKEKEKMEKEKAELQAQIEAAKKEKEESEKEKKEKAEHIEKLEKELAELKAAQLSAARTAILIAGGLDEKEAEAHVKTYAAFNDEQFKSVAATVINANKTATALKEFEKNGKISAETLEQMNITPEGETKSKKEEDPKKKDDEEGKKKSKSNSVFAALGGATPKVGQKQGS